MLRAIDTNGKQVCCVTCNRQYECKTPDKPLYHGTELEMIEVDGVVFGGQCSGCASYYSFAPAHKGRDFYPSSPELVGV